MKDLMDLLGEIAAVKSTAFPKLQTVGFFRPDGLLWEEGEMNCERWQEIQHLHRMAGIEITGSHYHRGREAER